MSSSDGPYITVDLAQRSCSLTLCVRYTECDPRGLLHHARYLEYFEMGRTALLRCNGVTYRDLEAAGRFFVVARMKARFHRPARYDDTLQLTTTHVLSTYARIDHEYRLLRGDALLCTASSAIACVDRRGVIVPMPEVAEWLERLRRG